MNQPTCAIGVDLGGQSVKLALVDANGDLRHARQIPIDAHQPTDDLTQRLIDVVLSAVTTAHKEGFAPTGVGLVMPGYMNEARTRLLFAANLPTLSGSTVIEDMRDALPVPLLVDADVNGAAIGEYRFGAGQRIDRLIVATVGTGIGAGVVIGGRILRIREHIAGSLGHIIVNPRGPRCPCGAAGCVEAMASGRAIEQRANEAAWGAPESELAKRARTHGRLTGREIAEALSHEDEAAGRIVHEAGWWLGVGVASWTVIYAPQKILIGGGMSALGEPFLEAIREGFREVGQPGMIESVSIASAALGPQAGVLGAAALAMNNA